MCAADVFRERLLELLHQRAGGDPARTQHVYHCVDLRICDGCPVKGDFDFLKVI